MYVDWQKSFPIAFDIPRGELPGPSDSRKGKVHSRGHVGGKVVNYVLSVSNSTVIFHPWQGLSYTCVISILPAALSELAIVSHPHCAAGLLNSRKILSLRGANSQPRGFIGLYGENRIVSVPRSTKQQ